MDFGLSEAVGTIGLLAALITLSVIDWRTYRLPNVLTWPLILGGLIYNFIHALDFYPYILGAVLGYTIFWTVENLYRLVRKREGLGRGDAKLLAAGGAWCGAMALPFIIFLGSGAALIYVLMKPVEERSNLKLPFGPFLAVAVGIIFLALNSGIIS